MVNHQQRTWYIKDEPFTEDMKLTMKKVNFLANSTNKQQFINMLGNYLEKKCKVCTMLPGDADVLIVQKAVESATLMDTALVGEDTDLLILLCCHASLDSHNFFFFNQSPRKTQRSPKCGTSRLSRSNNILFLHAVPYRKN